MSRPKAVHQMTAPQFDALFKTEADCIVYLVARRWPKGVNCPRCGNAKVYALASGHHWQCTVCAPGGSTGYRFSHLTGTIFENTNKPLKDWYRVAHLMLVSKKGMSALQIFGYMGFGSYKTAWLMCHKIRTAMVEDIKQLGGIVEVDETYVGGSDKKRHWDKKSGQRGRGDTGKTAVVGAVKRKGNVVARVVENTNRETLEAFVRETVSNRVSLLCTDAYPGYVPLKHRFPHQTVDHTIGQHVVGAVHTNTIEGFWSILKRGVVGTFHKVSRKSLHLYVAELQFRYNNRENGWFPSHEKYCETNQYAGNEECATYHVAMIALWQIGKFFEYISAPLTAIATAFIAWFTWTLWRSNEKMWRITKHLYQSS